MECLEGRALLAVTVTPNTANLLADASAIVIAGTGFDPIVANDSVTFTNGNGSVTGTVTAATATTITVAIAPASQLVGGNLSAQVTVGGTSSTSQQVATVVPVITSSTDNLSAHAGSIVIVGYGFDTTSINDSVTFNSGAITGTITAATTTSLTVTLPSDPTGGTLTAAVTTNTVISSEVQVGTVTPVITSAVTGVTANATTMTINGYGFDTTFGNNLVTFNDGATGTVTGGSATSLTVTFGTKPTTAGTLTAVVTTHGAGSGLPVQVATVTPVITSSTAGLAANSTALTINGFGFDTMVAGDSVTFTDGAGTATGTVTAATSTALTVTFSQSPTLAGPLTAVVQSHGQSSGAPVQVAKVTPVVTSSTAALAINATTIIINGYGFDTVIANDGVVFNDGAVGTVSAATANSLTVTIGTAPTAVGSLTATVTTNTAAGSSVQVATVAPVVLDNIAYLLPDSSASVTIIGAGFDTTPANNTVTFNDGAVGTVSAATATSLTVLLSPKPATAGPLTAVVTTNNVSSGVAVPVATVTPVVTTSSASLAANAATLAITGSGFDPTPGQNTVAFNDGATGIVTAATATSLLVTFTHQPTTAGNLTAVVTTNGNVSGPAVQVASVTPVVTSSTADLAANATTLTINGYGFNATTPSKNTVVFNGTAVGTVTAATATSLTVTFATAPTGGSLTAAVTTNSQSSGAQVQVATVLPVVLANAAYKPSASATTLLINGFGFDTTPGNNTVAFSNGAIAQSVTASSANLLTVVLSTSPTSAGPLTAVVTTNGASGTAVQIATPTPVVTSSAAALAAGSTTLTIAGQGFDPTAGANTVTFSDGSATPVGAVTAATATSLTVTFSTPPSVTGRLMAVVTTDGASSSSVQVASIAPTVTSSTTSLAANTGTLTIGGSGFDTTPANNSVAFNDGAIGAVTSATATLLTVTLSTMPSAVGSLTAVVTSDGISSGSAVQVATVAPVVLSSSNNLAANATTVTIRGFDFDTTPGNNTVTFNNGAVGSVTAASATSLTVTFSTKPAAGNLTAVVTTNSVSSGAAVQVATVTPVVTSSASSLAANAATLAISGFGFDPTGTNTVTFNDGAVGSVTSVSATSLIVTLATDPTTAGPLTAVVTTNGVSSGIPVQVAAVIPVVSGSTASLAANATTVTISGYGFSAIPSHDTVTFNDGAVGTITAASATLLTVAFVTKPVSVGSLTASVTANGASGGTAVQVAAITPVVTSNASYRLAGNASTVTINGFGFDATAGNNTVVFNNGAAGTVTSATATSLTVTFSTKPTAGNVTAVVTTDSVTSGAPVQVASVTPVVTSNASILAANSATVVIGGYGFNPSASGNTVAFSGSAAGTVTSATATSLTVTFTEAPTAGSLTAVVTTGGATSGAAVQVASVVPAVTSSLASLAASASTLTINGSGFDTTPSNNTVVFSSGAVGTVTASTATSLTVTFTTKPTAGNLMAVVTSDNVSSGSALQVATVGPVVTSSSASLAANAATLTISGRGFDTTPSRNSVIFSGGAAGIVSAATATSLTVTFSTAPTAGNLTATVISNGASSGVAVQVAAVTPSVTSSTVHLPINASSIVINGYGFNATAANNTVIFNNGAVGTVTAATATSLTVTFGTKPTAVGVLNATVTTGGQSSGAVQVATVAPVVTSSTASLSSSATQVTINGFGFSTTPGNNTVVLNNGATGTVAAATATALTLTITGAPTSGNLTAVMTTSGVSSGAAIQVASVSPVVTSSTASLTANTAAITIRGSGFDPTAANNTVAFSGGAVGNVTVATATTLTVVFSTAPTAGSLTAIVTTNGASNAAAVQVAAITPVVTSSTSSLAINGTTVVINGYGFDTTATHNTLTFNDGATGTVSAATRNSLTVTFAVKPAATGSLTAVVATNSQSSGSAVQVATVVTALGAAPSVTSSTANLAANAASITINGSNFNTTPANNAVTFNSGATGTVTAATANSLTVSLTAAPTAGNLMASVRTIGVSSGAAVQVSTVTPVVTNSTASRAINSTTITINGFGFDPTASHNTVAFNNGATGTVSAASATSLTVTFANKPTAVGSLTATVTTNSVGSGAVQVATVVPAVTSSAANAAINANTLTITGTGFSTTAGNNLVAFNNGATGTVTSATATSLTVTFGSKPAALGSLTAVVTTSGASSGSAVQVATVSPAVTSSTAALPATTSTFTINGLGFDPAPAHNTVVFNNGAAGVVTGASATSLTVTFSVAPAAGSVTAIVTTNGVSSGTAVQVATVTPIVTGSLASLAANATTLTISGFGFSTTPANNTVSFNGQAVGTVTAATGTSLTVTFSNSSRLALGNLAAIVTTNGTSSGSAVQVASVVPAVTSSTARLAINASTIAISGAGFDTTPANNTVVFNDGAVGTVTSATATSLTVTFGTKPTAVGNLTAVVTTNGVSSGSAVQVATVGAVVNSNTASQLGSASTVTINGLGFDTTSGNNTIVFSNGAVGTATGGSGTSLTVTFSTKPIAGNLTAIVTAFGVSSGPAVQVATISPVVTTSTANLSITATQIIINGFGFDPTAANNRVVFNDGAIGTVTSATKTSLTVVFATGKKPAATGSLTAIITTNGVSSGVAVQVATVV
jgi:uncharacterized protein YkvS